LPAKEFFEVVQRHRREHGWRGPGREGGDRGGPAHGPRPLSHQLMEALRSKPEEVLQYGDLPAEERRTRLFEHRRERVLSILRDNQVVDEARLAEIAAMSEPELYKALRRAFPNSPDRRGGNRGAPGGPARGHNGVPTPDGTPPKD
jgi:hypothetical protein